MLTNIKYSVTFLMVVFFAIFLVSCNKTEKTYYNSGKLMEKYEINKDSLKDGTYERYFEGGALAEILTYYEGKQNGERIIYHESGKTESVCRYVNGLIQGGRKVFYQSGELKYESNYEDSKLSGLFVAYYENGNKKEEVTFADDFENGPFVEYHENGKIDWKGQYLNGENEFGLLENYDSTGILIKKMMCDSIRNCVTIWKKEDEPIK